MQLEIFLLLVCSTSKFFPLRALHTTIKPKLQAMQNPIRSFVCRELALVKTEGWIGSYRAPAEVAWRRGASPILPEIVKYGTIGMFY